MLRLFIRGMIDRYSPDSRVGDINKRPIEVSNSTVSSTGSCEIIPENSVNLKVVCDNVKVVVFK
jgi:hypothetical protein